MPPGLVQPGSRRRRRRPPAAPLAEVAHLAGVLQAYLDTLRRDFYTRPCQVEDCAPAHRDIPEEGARAHSSRAAARPPLEAKCSASFCIPALLPPPRQVPGRGAAIGQ